MLLRRRRQARPAEHADVYFADGSMVSLVPGAPGAQRLLALAHEALRAAGTVA